MKRAEIISWLKETRPERLEYLWRWADRVRKEHVGNQVHLRGIIEISNCCMRACHYCGINSNNHSIKRYQLSHDDIMESVRHIESLGFGTVVIQAGEHPAISETWTADLIKMIKRTTPLAVTLSLGERSRESLALWKACGADRYLLKFETSNKALYSNLHPGINNGWQDRFEIMTFLKRLNYEVGSGFMIGLPGQSIEDLAKDIEICSDLELDMLAAGPFIRHHNTPLGKDKEIGSGVDDQVDATPLMVYKTMALLRIMNPETNIPSTSALSTIDIKKGRELGLCRGANVFMPNMTPPKYRSYYEIYPGRAANDTGFPEMEQIIRLLSGMNRIPGTGPGHSKHFVKHFE